MADGDDYDDLIDRFIEEEDIDLGDWPDDEELTARAAAFFDRGAEARGGADPGATPRRISTVKVGLLRHIAATVRDRFGLTTATGPRGVSIVTKAGRERVVRAVTIREVRAPPSWGPGARMEQLRDADTGRIIGQRRKP